MKIIEDNFNKVIYPPVIVKCGKCSSIIQIDKGDAILNEHYIWNWKCPCCGKDNKSGSQWQLQLIETVEEDQE